MARHRLSRIFYFVIVFGVVSCTPRTEATSDKQLSAVLDSLSQIDPTPIKKMPDTLVVSSAHPLVICDRQNSDSVTLFPYSLLFRQKDFNAYIVSFNDFSPSLVTLDKDEVIIDSMSLIGSVRKETPDCRESRRVRIVSPLDIVTTDSIFKWEVNVKKERLPHTKKLKVVVKKYSIDDTGRITGKEK